MSDRSGGFENYNLSEQVDVIGSSKSTDFSDSIDSTTDSVEQVGRTLDNFSGILDIPTPRGGPMPTRYKRESAQRLRQILNLGPTTLPDRSFMDELSGVRASKQPWIRTDPWVVDLTGEEDTVATRITGQPNSSGREEGSD